MRIPIKKYLPEILTGLAVGGVISSNLLWAYAARQELMDGDKKHYILPLITTAGTITCIIASNRVSNMQKMSILAGGTMLAQNYIQQRKAIEETCTTEEIASIDELLIMANEAYKSDEAFVDHKELYFLPQFNKVFWARPCDVVTAQLNINERFAYDGEAYLNEFFTDLGILTIEEQVIAEVLKWRLNYNDIDAGIKSICFQNTDKVLSNGQICHYIEFLYPPQTEAMWQLEYDDIGA